MQESLTDPRSGDLKVERGNHGHEPGGDLGVKGLLNMKQADLGDGPSAPSALRRLGARSSRRSAMARRGSMVSCPHCCIAALLHCRVAGRVARGCKNWAQR